MFNSPIKRRILGDQNTILMVIGIGEVLFIFTSVLYGQQYLRGVFNRLYSCLITENEIFEGVSKQDVFHMLVCLG